MSYGDYQDSLRRQFKNVGKKSITVERLENIPQTK